MESHTPTKVSFLLPANYRLPAAYQTDDPQLIARLLTAGADYYVLYENWTTDKCEGERYAAITDKHRRELTKLTADKEYLEQQLNSISVRIRKEVEDETQKRIAMLQQETQHLRAMLSESDDRTASLVKREEATNNRILIEKERQLSTTYDQLTRSEERRKDLEDMLLQKTKTLASSQRRGQEGERIFEELAKEAGFADITSTGKEIHMCDYRATVNSLSIFFEIKNHESAVANDQITKFLRDMKEHPDVGAGVFLAMNAPLPSHRRSKKLWIEWLPDNRPVIYVGEFMKEDPMVMLEMIHYYLKGIDHMHSIYETDDTIDSRLEYEEKIRKMTSVIEQLVDRYNLLSKKIAADKFAANAAYDGSLTMVRGMRDTFVQMINIITGQPVDEKIFSSEAVAKIALPASDAAPPAKPKRVRKKPTPTAATETTSLSPPPN
jgi:hypothetical protein